METTLKTAILRHFRRFEKPPYSTPKTHSGNGKLPLKGMRVLILSKSVFFSSRKEFCQASACSLSTQGLQTSVCTSVGLSRYQGLSPTGSRESSLRHAPGFYERSSSLKSVAGRYSTARSLPGLTRSIERLLEGAKRPASSVFHQEHLCWRLHRRVLALSSVLGNLVVVPSVPQLTSPEVNLTDDERKGIFSSYNFRPATFATERCLRGEFDEVVGERLVVLGSGSVLMNHLDAVWLEVVCR